jgi:hypothetical protein
VLLVALIAAGGGAVLLYAAHRPVALIVLGAFGVFAAALTLVDRVIELNPELSTYPAAAGASFVVLLPQPH